MSASPSGRMAEAGDAPRRTPSPLSMVVLVAGLILTGALTGLSVSIHRHNEDRLLTLELNQAASVVAAAVPSIEIPLSAAAEEAAATDGNAADFRASLQSYVGPGSKGPFASASLWRLGSGPPTLVVDLGQHPELAATPAEASTFLAQVRRSAPLAVLNLLRRDHPGIGYATVPAAASAWVVYAERILPADRKLTVTRNSAFSQLNYALYLGRTPVAANLLEAAGNQYPLVGQRASATVPFGDSAITLVATANGELGGTLLARLPLIVALAGVLLTMAAAVMSDYLVRRRRQAEWLATENRRMYSEQRGIAEVLQHALLPQALPEIAGVETAMRYVAGGVGADVGGDWFDIIPMDDHRFFFVLGDVSGRGVQAATIMARLHFAIRAYAVQGDAPEAILGKLGRLLTIETDRSFATILCAFVDVPAHAVTLVNAGHPPLLVLDGDSADFVRTTVFPPVGVQEATPYVSVSIVVPAGATIVAFTDGLIERRDETIDASLERLRALAVESRLDLEHLLTKILTESTPGGYSDDTAILAVRWTN